MKVGASLLAVIIVAWVQGAAAQPATMTFLGREAVTTLSSSSKALKVSVAIWARAVKTSDAIANRGEPGQLPDTLTVIQKIELTVNGSRIQVPHSAYADLLDVRQAVIDLVRGPSLIFQGGDASESFVARIEFDRRQVTRRAVFWSLPGEPLEETIYHRRVLQDE